MFSSLTNFFTNTSKKKSSQSEENNHSFSNSTESLLVQSTKKILNLIIKVELTRLLKQILNLVMLM